MGRWNEDGVVSTVKILKDMAKNILNIVVNNVNHFGRTFVTIPEALDYPTGRSEFLPVRANLQVCEGRDKMTGFLDNTSRGKERVLTLGVLES
jgi:hypothetical protein